MQRSDTSILAAQEVRVIIVELLLRPCTRKSDIDHGDRTPLTRASGNGHEAVVRLLIDLGTDANIHNGGLVSDSPVMGCKKQT